MQPIEPRHFSPGAGSSGDRVARCAARQTFLALRLTFLGALQGLPDGEWLMEQVRAAEEPVDLWLLRAPVFAALVGVDNERRGRRQSLRRGLDSLFPDLEPASNFLPF